MYSKQISQKASPSLQVQGKNQSIKQSQSYGSLSSLVQRVQQNSGGVSTDERQLLESTIGTRSTREILSGKQKNWVPEFQGISVELQSDTEQVREPIQAKSSTTETSQEASRISRPNQTGLPNRLKTGVENLSGMSLDDVKVHYNSPKPFEIKAQAHAQGSEIHIAPGQEKHLPHEVWHIAQQKQGRVKQTMQKIGNVTVNNDVALEAEADVMGAKAMQINPANQVLKAKTKESEATQNEVSRSDAVQMAGHAGVMIFSSDSKLLKRVEINEANEFENIMNKQNSGDKMALNTFPKIYRVEKNYNGSALGLLGENYNKQRKNEKAWVAKHNNGDSYVEMESLGGQGVDVLDFKIGQATADFQDLRQNYGRSKDSAKKKVARMKKVDQNSETAEFGLRDSDQLKNNKTHGVMRWLGNYRATLTAVDARLKKDGYYPENAQVFKDLENIYKYLDQSKTVYVASSLIMKWTPNRKNKTQEDRVVLIDLAHPITSKMDGFEEVKKGMLLGIMNLHAMLGGEERSKDWVRFDFKQETDIDINV
jgi:Domain of unknown function (DUF4157)/Inositol polyphosphate kinase